MHSHGILPHNEQSCQQLRLRPGVSWHRTSPNSRSMFTNWSSFMMRRLARLRWNRMRRGTGSDTGGGRSAARSQISEQLQQTWSGQLLPKAGAAWHHEVQQPQVQSADVSLRGRAGNVPCTSPVTVNDLYTGRTVVLIQAGAEVLRVVCGEEGPHAAREQVAHHQRALEAHPFVRLEALQRRDCRVHRMGMNSRW